MKRAFRTVGLAGMVAMLALSGCRKSSSDPLLAGAGSDAAAAASAAVQDADSAAKPVAVAATKAGPGARKVHEANSVYEFDYAYPAAAAAIPGLRAWFEADLAKTRKDIAAQAKDGQADARANHFDFFAYSSSAEWQVVADLPGWLSLSGTVGDYTGGAHPNHGFASLLWDKGAGRQRQVADLFTSKAALAKAISGPFCDALDKQRAHKRGSAVNRQSGDEFDKCIDPTASTLILGSSKAGAHPLVFDRIGVLVGPYEAGPYAEGDYEVTLPVSKDVLDAVKPEYRESFAAGV